MPRRLRIAASENDHCLAIEDYATRRGWTWYHPLPARMPSGRIITAFRGRRGLPDYVFARAGVVLFREVKRDTTYPDPDQRHWGVQLGALYGLWHMPRDWDLVHRELQ